MEVKGSGDETSPSSPDGQGFITLGGGGSWKSPVKSRTLRYPSASRRNGAVHRDIAVPRLKLQDRSSAGGNLEEPTRVDAFTASFTSQFSQ